MLLHRHFSFWPLWAASLLTLTSIGAQEQALSDENRKLGVPHSDDAYMKYHSDDYHYYVKAPKAPKAKGKGGGKGQGKGALGDTPLGELLAEIAEEESLTILLELVECAGLIDLLDTTYGITLFAPNDEAFDGVSVDFLCSEEGLPSLTNILAYHVVPHVIPASSIGHEDYYKTLQGETVVLRSTADGITVNDATVVSGDIKAKNGISESYADTTVPCFAHASTKTTHSLTSILCNTVHVINGVLFPKGPGSEGKVSLHNSMLRTFSQSGVVMAPPLISSFFLLFFFLSRPLCRVKERVLLTQRGQPVRVKEVVAKVLHQARVEREWNRAKELREKESNQVRAVLPKDLPRLQSLPRQKVLLTQREQPVRVKEVVAKVLNQARVERGLNQAKELQGRELHRARVVLPKGLPKLLNLPKPRARVLPTQREQ
jgi:uncharacterized surface protein with fasciclin (FAS1) repeats